MKTESGLMKTFIAEMSVGFHLEVAHWMPNFPEGHPNRSVHGHSYQGLVKLRGKVNPQSGVVMEYSELKALVDRVVSEVDHRMLNDLPGLGMPTSENLAEWLWSSLKPKLPDLFEVVLERPSIGMQVSFRGEYR